MASRPSTTLISCRGAETILVLDQLIRLEVSSRWFSKGAGFQGESIPKYSTTPPFKSSIHWKFIKCGRRFTWDLRTQQKQSFVNCKSKDSIQLLFQSKKNKSVVLTFLFHAIGVWTPKTIGRTPRTSNPYGSTGKIYFGVNFISVRQHTLQ